MGSVHQLHTAQPDPLLDAAIATFLRSLASPNTIKTYRPALQALAAEFGPAAPVSALNGEAAADRIADLFDRRWAGCAPKTGTTRYDGLRSAISYWQRQGWLADSTDPLRRITKPVPPPTIDRAWSAEQIEELLARRDLPLRERLLYRMLYETAARVAEVLRLDVTDLDRPNRQARVIRKGGAQDWIVWQTGTAALLPRYLQGRTTGPLFLTGRRARVALPPADLDPVSGRARLSYNRVAELWTEHTGGGNGGIHDLRHTALTHATEAGMSTPMLKRKSGHRSITSLARYTKPSVDSLRKWQAGHDPAGRRLH